MPKLKVVPVILCGGTGSRLWPLSRSSFPKQFLQIYGEETLFQSTIKRLKGIVDPAFEVQDPLVVASEEHRYLLMDQLREINISSNILLEPVPKNTAPALTIAALQAQKEGDDPVLVVMPSDQVIKSQHGFFKSIKDSIDEANKDSIVVLGINPSRPETGYGYIESEYKSELATSFKVLKFKEKPNQALAQSYLNKGGYTWNSGIFVLKTSIWLKALATFRSDILEACIKAFDEGSSDAEFIRPHQQFFDKVPSESIDYAVMEKSAHHFSVVMVPLDAGWSDLGAWDAVWEVKTKDRKGNVRSGDVHFLDTSNSLVYSENRLVAAIGLEDVVIVDTPDALLVSKKNQTQLVKNLVADLGESDRQEQVFHRKVTRPWGWFDVLDSGPFFKVKKILVKPQQKLSLQRHKYRSEHWVVVKGVAKVQCGSSEIVLKENQSTYIPIGELHCLSNPGPDDLEVIEVQSGAYLGEDDIERLGDSYGRIK